MNMVLWVEVTLAIIHSPPLDVGEDATFSSGRAGRTTGMGCGCTGTGGGGVGGGEGGRVGGRADGWGGERAAEGGHDGDLKTGGKWDKVFYSLEGM